MNENFVETHAETIKEETIGTVPPQATVVDTSVQKKDNSKGMAIASLVLGIVSFFCCGPISAVVGIVLGVISRKNNPTENGMATAGIVLSVIALVLWVVLLIWSIVTTGHLSFTIGNLQ